MEVYRGKENIEGRLWREREGDAGSERDMVRFKREREGREREIREGK
jgi:hypothetical protein